MSPEGDVIVNELSSVYHAILLGETKCGALFPRRFMSRDWAEQAGFRPCGRCYR